MNIVLLVMTILEKIIEMVASFLGSAHLTMSQLHTDLKANIATAASPAA